MQDGDLQVHELEDIPAEELDTTMVERLFERYQKRNGANHEEETVRYIGGPRIDIVVYRRDWDHFEKATLYASIPLDGALSVGDIEILRAEFYPEHQATLSQLRNDIEERLASREYISDETAAAGMSLEEELPDLTLLEEDRTLPSREEWRSYAEDVVPASR